MSLQYVNTTAKTIHELFSWFIDIYHHLSKDNYQNGDWSPVVTGGTGSPTIAGKYTRWGQQLDFTVIITGTYSTTSAYINNLPFSATDYGALTVYSVESGFIGNGYIAKNTKNAYLPNISVTTETLIISGKCRISGI